MKINNQILTETTVNITEFKKDPLAVISKTKNSPVAILKNNQPAFYCISAKAYELLIEKLDDLELARLVTERKNSAEIELSLDSL